MNCKYIKPDGTRCNMKAIKGSNLCFTHNPQYKDQKELAVKTGGLNRRSYFNIGDFREINTPKDIRDIIGEAINLLRVGNLPSNSPANSLAYLCKVWLEAHEASEVEAKIEEMEDRLDKAGL
jgi:hypothetical protein